MSKSFFEKLTDVCHNLLLDNEDLMHYLKEHRGVSKETISTYKLGAFPKDLRDLYNRHDMDAKELREQNIIWNADRSQFQLYPVVIPIRNVEGKPIAIGCRTLYTDDKRKEMGIPKYRNSTYKKSFHLFGLERAVEAIRKTGIVYVVEGYFDVISAHQMGIMNVVATCGTIFSTRQLLILSRYTDKICLLFDNDDAGRRSAKGVISKLGDYNSDISIMCKFTPDGYKDLDEYLNNGGDVSFFGEERIDLDDVEITTLW